MRLIHSSDLQIGKVFMDFYFVLLTIKKALEGVRPVR